MWLRKYFGGAGGAVRRPSRAYSAMRRESGYPDFGHNAMAPNGRNRPSAEVANAT
jgi:hypothetical protein